jgi:hypothetical protein
MHSNNRAGQRATLSLDNRGKLVIGSERVVSHQAVIDCPVLLNTHTGGEWYVSESDFERVTDMSAWDLWFYLRDYFYRK